MSEIRDEFVSKTSAAATERRLPAGVRPDIIMSQKLILSQYESVFSWTVKEQAGEPQNLMVNFLDWIREKCDAIVADKDDVFNVTKFFYKLIVINELYILGNFDESLKEIEIIVKSIDSDKFDETSNQYLAAYKHIARSTYAYIALAMNCYFEKIMDNVKPINILSQAEKSAICALKACVFMEYPPFGNEFALKFANEARNLYSNEPQWVVIWLKAKGRVRRLYSVGKSMPDNCEVEAASILCSQKNPKPIFLITACKVYHDVANIYEIRNNKEKSQKYYKLGADILIDASKLINDDVRVLSSCLFTWLFAPKEFQSKDMINQIVKKLKTVDTNSSANDVLGEYYFKYEEDYDKSKMYFSRGMFSGQFRCAMQLLRIDCLLKSVDTIQYAQTLKMIYKIFPSPKRRLIVVTQMLFCYYHAENPKELIHSLKLLLALDVEDALKKKSLINFSPIFNFSRKELKPRQFLYYLTNYINYLRKHNKCNAEERIVVDDSYTLFTVITNENKFYKNNNYNFHHQSHECNSEKKYYGSSSSLLNNTTKNSWRKKQDNSIEGAIWNTITRDETKGENKFEKLMPLKNETNKYQIGEPEDNTEKSLMNEFNKHLNISNSPKNDVEPNKSKNQNVNDKIVHVPNSKNNPFLKSTYGSEADKFNFKNKYQNRQQIDQCAHGNKINIQEQGEKSSLSNNFNTYNPPKDFRAKNKIINWSNNPDIISKTEHKFMTNKLDWRFQADRHLRDQSKQH